MGSDDAMGGGATKAAYPRLLRVMLVAALAMIISLASVGNILWFYLNILEFGDLYIRPIYFQLVGGFILAVIAFARIDIKNRRSIVWWAVRLIIRLIRQRGILEAVPPNYLDFKTFRMTPFNFVAWQATKVILGMLLLMNLLFGMAVVAMVDGWDANLGSVTGIFSLPFVTPPFDTAYAQEIVIPMVPALSLIIAPVLGAIGIRLGLLVALTQLIRVFTPSVVEMSEGRRRIGWRVAVVEALIAMGLFWGVINSFFTSYIDYNTKLIIGGLAAAGILFCFFAYLDGVKDRGLGLFLTKRGIFTRMVAVALIVLIVSSAIAIQNSTADARKREWLGPYVTQQISVNRYLAQLDEVQEVPHHFGMLKAPSEGADAVISENAEILDRIRLWDWEAAFAKLKPEIGLIPYLDFQDSDILRFNKTLYWSASMKPVLPATVLQQDKWYAEHLVYTHAPRGFLMLDANKGTIVDTGSFFKQRRIYYGEGGLLHEVWAAYPVGRQTTDEIENFFYDGTGGIDLQPPLSWIFEFIFFLSFRDQTVHVMRYKDVYDRTSLLFPYFQYTFGEKQVDMLPVTDGKDTYWLMPLIVNLNVNNVPWSRENYFMRLTGYALIDIYNGSIQLLVLGDDFFSTLFKTVYSDYVMSEVPDWLRDQLRYPQELFEWRVGMYNYYHVRDPVTFIVGRMFYEVPAGLTTYYVMSQPPGSEEIKYVGLLSLELKGAAGRNLAGYMIVDNEYDNFGQMTFYQVDTESPTKLLGPTAVREALERNPDFATLRTLLRAPRVGDNIIYRIGDYDVYFIPVYTAGAGGVVSEIGTIAAVGATFTGEYYVGLGNTAQAAFKAFLNTLPGAAVTPPPTPPPTELTLEELIKQANDELQAYHQLWAQGKYEEAGKHFQRFQDLWNQIQQLVEQS
ncbi:MAG: UPF0182 family protein [Candidatus Bathyarchaeia archaeon]